MPSEIEGTSLILKTYVKGWDLSIDIDSFSLGCYLTKIFNANVKIVNWNRGLASVQA